MLGRRQEKRHARGKKSGRSEKQTRREKTKLLGDFAS
jgi:hypothetical protein